MKSVTRTTVLFALAVLLGVYCSNDSDGVPIDDGKNVDYQDLDGSPHGKCQDHEEYSECSGDPACQKTCENMDRWETMTCADTKICVRGCVCEGGFVRENYNGVCVRENSCPRVRH